MVNTSFSNKTQYLRFFCGFFYFTGSGSDIKHLGLGRTRSDHEQWRACRDEGEGEEKEEWLAVETAEAGGELRELP